MGFVKKYVADNGGGNYPLAEAGSQPAVLVALIDLGTQREQFQGQAAKDVRKVFLVWEVRDGSDALLGRDYAFSFHEKASLRHIIDKWRGRQMQDGEEFDLAVLVGKPCLLSITHKVSGAGKTYAKIDGVSQLPKAMLPGIGKPKTPTYTYEIESDDLPSDDAWPRVYGEPLTDVIRRSKEYMARHGGERQGDAYEPAGAVANGTADPAEAADFF